jgi:hypothetical protein
MSSSAKIQDPRSAARRISTGPRADSTATLSAFAPIGYWAATLFVAVTSLAAGVADMLHVQPLYGIMLHLGYPPYFATLLGLGKVVGAAVLLAPRGPLVKEWAYAALFCDYCCATVSHVAAGDGIGAVAGPLFAFGALVASWYLRPASRRLATATTGSLAVGVEGVST